MSTQLPIYAMLLLGGWLISGAASAASASERLPAEVRARVSGAGAYLTDAQGRSLYFYAQDSRPGKSDCNAECAKAWPPLLAPTGAAAAGDWSIVNRDDGAQQWAWRGRPLYGFAKDNYAGAMLGDGVGSAWHVALQPVAVPPGLAMRSIYLGRVLTDARGHSLYWRRDEVDDRAPTAKSKCQRECLQAWTPLYAPWMAHPQGDWAVLARDDGQKQWLFRGHRLYRYENDLKPGDSAGLSEDANWEVAVLDAAAPTPSWVTVQNSDMGEVFADAQGHTLYIFNGQLDRTRQLMCDDNCIQKNWRMLPVPPGAKPAGDWAPVDSPLGTKGAVWGYKGNAVYTHTRDREPGAIGGDAWATGVGGSGRGWVPVLRHRDNDE